MTETTPVDSSTTPAAGGEPPAPDDGSAPLAGGSAPPVHNACYHPGAFRPDNKPLLDVAAWRRIQLFLVTASQLPLTPDQYPEPRALPIFNAIHSSAGTFGTDILPKSLDLARALLDFGQSSMDTFDTIVALLQQGGDGVKDDITSLYQDLIDIATEQEQEVAVLVTGTQAFSNALQAVEVPLETLVKTINDELGPLQAQVKALNYDIINVQNKIIGDAQHAILEDQRVIRETAYYAWIPIIGAIVAAAEIGTHTQDINNQAKLINDASKQVVSDHATLAALSDKIGHLTMASGLLNSQDQVIGELLPSIVKLSGAWSGIGGQMANVVKDIEKSEEKELANQRCLSERILTTTINEFETVCNDAHNFLMNFQMQASPNDVGVPNPAAAPTATASPAAASSPAHAADPPQS